MDMAHMSHKDTEQITIEASITLDDVPLTDSLIRWSPNKWPSVCRGNQCLPIRRSGRLISLQNEHSIHVHMALHAFLLFFIIIPSEVRLSPLGTAATTDLLYQPRMIDDDLCGAMVEWRLAGETEVLGGNLPRATLSTINPTWADQGSNPDPRSGKPATRCLSYGTAMHSFVSQFWKWLAKYL
jgi:hypothetical protein